MNRDGVQLSPPIQDFRGEVRTLSENLLPVNVSPDALNIDYRDGTVRKRRGVSRLGAVRAMMGALMVNRQYSGSSYGRQYAQSSGPALSFSASLHTYACVVDVSALAVNSDVRLWVHETSGGVGTGLWLKNVAGAYHYEARCEHSGGTLAVTRASAIAAFVPVAVTVSFDTVTKTLTLRVDSSTTTGTLGANTYTQPTGRIYLGDVAAGDYDKEAWLADFRVWDGPVAAAIAINPLVPLTAAEQTSALIAYWRMMEYSATSVVDDSGNGRVLQVFGERQGVYPLPVPAVDEAHFDVVEAVSVDGYFATRRGVYSSSLLFSLATDLRSPSLRDFRVQLLTYRDYLIVLNGYETPLTVNGQLSYEAPVIPSGLTITASGSGGSIDAGVHSYLFSIYNSITGVESAIGTAISSQTAAANDKFTLDFTTGGFMPSRYYRGADEIRIYRTRAGGALYYHLADVPITTTSYEDTAADSTLVTARPLYTGYGAPSRFGFVLNDSLWLGNQEGAENRLIYTEPGTLGAFFSDNYLDLDNGNSDALTGGISVGGRAVVFKLRSAWIVSGAGGSVAAEEFFPGVGCVQHATIAASPDALYWLAEGGVYTMPLPIGAGPPVSLMLAGWRGYFEAMTREDYENCSAIWDPLGERYLLGVTIAGVRQTLVYCKGRNAWALWDLESSGFALVSEDGGSPTLYCGWRNWRAAMEQGLSDALYGNDAFDQAMVGVATGGSTTTLENSTALWMTDNGGLLQNVDVTVVHADGTRETRRVVTNSSTVLTVSPAWDVAPVAGDAYYLGAIDAHWRTPWLGMDSWGREKQVHKIRLLSRVPSDAAEADSVVSATFGRDGDGALDETFSWAVSSRVRSFAPAKGRCSEAMVGVSDFSPNHTFDLAGIALSVTEGEAGP